MTKGETWSAAYQDVVFRQALSIRTVEESFLSLFDRGMLKGTVHTCIGQEFSAIALGGQLEKEDVVFSNHRCHGHYLAKTGDYEGLIAEVIGRAAGVCSGIGGSQHLCRPDFYSNGIQGGIVPVGAGIALQKQMAGADSIVVVFIGDGTLGEGIVYESLNIISKWHLPILLVLENNQFVQSTEIQENLAGDIIKRVDAFGIRCYSSSTRLYENLFESAAESIAYVRNSRLPAFHLVDTYRLAPHSKGDDYRSLDEIAKHRQLDPLECFSKSHPDRYDRLKAEVTGEIDETIKRVIAGPKPSSGYYTQMAQDLPSSDPIEWEQMSFANSPGRMIEQINAALTSVMENNEQVMVLGEDIKDPYGGAFKATKGLYDSFPQRVYSTPISEAAIVGIANGLALRGKRPIVEIMFGDFVTLAMDQIVNHASKFHHMYDRKVHCPIVIRTPMGGRRGYGPTHSQSLEKILIGIDNVKVIVLNTWLTPQLIYSRIVENELHPTIVIENKTDYAKKFGVLETPFFRNYRLEKSLSMYPTLRFSPIVSAPDISLISYGGGNGETIKAAEILWNEHDILSEIVIPSQLSPVPIGDLMSAIHTDLLFTTEEGSACGNWGGEALISLMENGKAFSKAKRIASEATPIPAEITLEDTVLVNSTKIVEQVVRVCNGS